MKLEFQNSHGKRRVIGNPKTWQETNQIIKKFLDDHNFKSYYTRINFYPDEWEIDVGSWFEHMYLSELTDGVKKELEEEHERLKEKKVMKTGVVKWFNTQKGYGFITEDGTNKDYFLYYTGLVMDGFKTIDEGEKVKFDIQETPEHGTQAVNVQRV